MSKSSIGTSVSVPKSICLERISEPTIENIYLMGVAQEEEEEEEEAEERRRRS